MNVYMLRFDCELNRKYWKNELLYRHCRIRQETPTMLFVVLDKRPKYVDGDILRITFNGRSFELDDVIAHAPAYEI